MATTKKGGSEKKVGISYWSKDKVACPVCKKAFEREVMRSGWRRPSAWWTSSTSAN